jgi:hypothetical protein
MEPNPCSQARCAAEGIHLLEQALGFTREDDIHGLALALSCFQNAQAAMQKELAEILDQDTDDILLTAFSWRLLIPAPRVRSSMAWEDAEPALNPFSVWKQPAIIRNLVQAGRSSGRWQPEYILPLASTSLPRDAEAMAVFMDCVQQYAKGYVLSANLLRAALHEAGISADLERVIIDLKAAGAISPKLSSLLDTACHRSPLYEVNPAVFIHPC